MIFVGCSTKKDAFLNRNYHALSTKYNVLYNGNIALNDGLKELNQNYTDNFWERLPIEPLKVDKLALPGVKASTDASPEQFNKAEEKAVKAVQKHSMVIVRQERNNQIDNAYLLLGKARYYSKRFVPALEAFNYLLINYPNSELFHETKIWQAKTLIRLYNEEQAIENLRYLFKSKKLAPKVIEDAHTAMAMAYIKTDSLQKVIKHLNEAVLTSFNKEQTARNLFILGQLYREKGAIDSSNIAFESLINFKKAPYKYKIQAHIEKAKNVSTNEEIATTLELLNKLIQERDNRPYLNQLYYQKAILLTSIDTLTAIKNFKKSLANSKSLDYQKELTYQALGNIYFDKAQFSIAGSYYDSILQIADDIHTKRIHKLRRKRANLNNVILFEKTATQSDSILTLTKLSLEEQTLFFKKYIVTLKDKEATVEKQQIKTGSEFATIQSSKASVNNTGKWYFYNTQVVGFGEQEFRKIWGNRPLEDNWRLSDKNLINITQGKSTAVSTKNQPLDSLKYNVSYYVNSLPKNKKTIDSIIGERNNAYLQLGIIYKEQFNEPELAIQNFEKLLTFKPLTIQELSAKYNLYKIYLNTHPVKAEKIKADLIANYPNSKYTKILLNPNEIAIDENAESPETEYAILYYQYKAKEFDEVIEKCKEAVKKYEGYELLPKFELLKAYALNERDGVTAFKTALEAITLNFPNTEEGNKALELLKTINAKQ